MPDKLNSTFFSPGIVPNDPAQLPQYLRDLTVQLNGAIQSLDKGGYDKTYVAPTKPREGDMAYADGSYWNPGSGEGMYRYNGSAWAAMTPSSVAYATTAGTANALNASNNYTVYTLSATALTTSQNLFFGYGGAGGYINSADGYWGMVYRPSVNGSGGYSHLWTNNVGSGLMSLSTSGTLGANQFSGGGAGLTGTASGLSIGGNAVTATSATYLNNQNYIQRTGSSGNANTDFNNTPAGTYRYDGDDSGVANGPGNAWWFYENMRHSNGSNYWGTQIAWGWEDNANRLATRNVSAGSWGGWVYYLNSANYSGYSNFGGNNVYGGVFYDGNDTSFYCNPNGWSLLNSIRLRDNTGYYVFGSYSDPSIRCGSVMADSLTSYNNISGNLVYCAAAGGGSGTAMVNQDNRIGRWVVGSGYFEVLVDGGFYGVNFYPSDEKIKKNIVAANYDALNTVKQIEFKEFDFDAEQSIKVGHVKCGVIAQQIQSIDSNLVEKQGDFLTPKLDQMVYLSLKAAQEINNQITIQQTQINKMQSQIDALIAKVEI